jgi:hypothetical protein
MDVRTPIPFEPMASVELPDNVAERAGSTASPPYECCGLARSLLHMSCIKSSHRR